MFWQSRMMAALDEFKAALEHAMPERLTLAGAAAPLAVQPASVLKGLLAKRGATQLFRSVLVNERP